MKRITPFALVVAPLIAASCAPIEGPVVVEAVIPDDDGGVVLGDVSLDTVRDLNTGRGDRFDFRGDMRIDALSFNDLSGATFDDMVARVRGGSGTDLAPRMHVDGDRYVADDFETLYYFSSFANFEAAFASADAVGDTSRATSRDTDTQPIVGLYATLVLSSLAPVPLMSADNAAYAAPIDGWIALRAVYQQGTPFAMHRGVVAHEFGHRLFHHNVWSRVDGGFDAWRDRITDIASEDESVLRAGMLLKGIDEGLADVFAITTMQRADGVISAFSSAGKAYESEAVRRDVDGVFAERATYDNLRTLTLEKELLDACGLDKEEFGQGDFNFYCVGTVVAATMWRTAEQNPQLLRDEVEPAIIAALTSIGEALVNGATFDLDLFLEPFAAQFAPGRRRDAACTAIRARFASLVDQGRVPTCS